VQKKNKKKKEEEKGYEETRSSQWRRSGCCIECVVEGIIQAKHVDVLEVLLQGLCRSHRETVKVHEICLKTGPNLGKFPCSNLLSAVHVIV
jgi:hypothetical protein